jgi:hypothetical protein
MCYVLYSYIRPARRKVKLSYNFEMTNKEVVLGINGSLLLSIFSQIIQKHATL